VTRVADLMRAGVITCPPEALLGEVARRLSAHRVHSLLVAEDGGPPLGIISDTDLLAGEWLAGDPQALATMREMTARELMTTPVLTVDAGAPATEAISLLRKQEVHRLSSHKTAGQPVSCRFPILLRDWPVRRWAGRR
jgi:signal-transduction protein with cAMP-binding, CBS, and nucleotidyltransferase domain